MAASILDLSAFNFNAYLKANAVGFEHALDALSGHFQMADGMAHGEAWALAHKVLDISPEAWATAQGELRIEEQEGRADFARFMEKATALVASYRCPC